MKSHSEPSLYYAAEPCSDGTSQYVRFARKQNRDFWVSQKEGRRVCGDMRGLPGVTWEYIDGVSYANEVRS
jgi:hypothetical protein